MSELKINPKINIDSTETVSNTGNDANITKKNSQKKDSFEDIYKKISELKKGKIVATDTAEKKIEMHSDQKKLEPSDLEDIMLIKTELTTDGIESEQEIVEEEFFRVEKEKGMSKTALDEDEENIINTELQSILLGTSTQIITSRNLEHNTDQIIHYARKIGLKENAISILLKKEVGSAAKKQSLDITNQKIEKEIALKFDTNTIHNRTLLTKKVFFEHVNSKEIIKNQELKSSLDVKKRSNSLKSLDSKTEEDFDSNNSKNLKMLMKIKDESFLEKLLVKKIEEEHKIAPQRLNKLQAIDLGAKASEWINNILAQKNSEISNSIKNYELENTSLSLSNSVVGKSDSSGLGSSSQGQNSSKEYQTDQIQIKRQEQFQQMAQKLGETLAKRISEQISKGAWRVQIALKPASLGSIEISLNLRGKEIEASFHASQAFTRELIGESLPKLREGLEKAGMNVAGMNITSENDNKNGDNSTNKKDEGKKINIHEVRKEDDREKVEDKTIRIDESGGLNILV